MLVIDAARRVPLPKNELKNRLAMISEIQSSLGGGKTVFQKAVDSSAKIRFSFNETKPDLSTAWSRFSYFLSLSDPKYFFYSDEEIIAGIKTWRKFEKIA